MPKQERATIRVRAERAVLAAVRLPESIYDAQDPFGELTQNLPRPVSGTYMGVGKVRELRALCETLDAGTVIFDHDLSPKQISAIEEVTERKVIDRSELILDIFAGRATTHEAKLQVELAQLEYTFPRLRAMWDHLERLVGRGGVGGIGTRGPGEQQLETDRRLVQNRKLDLLRELHEIQARKRREVRERRALHFTVGIVGYTNAGKSTLFNTMTAGGAYADDRPFATLMTRTREWDLGAGLMVMLSDTVGFVRDLPHNLVASFKATLEEATHADLLLVVVDVSDPAAELQLRTVNSTLDGIFERLHESGEGDGPAVLPPRILLLNKADRLKDNAELLVWAQRQAGAIPLCALPAAPGRPPLGQAELVARVRGLVQGEVKERCLRLPLSESRAIHVIETRTQVLDRTYEGGEVVLRARIGSRQLERLLASGVRLRVEGEPPRITPPEAARWTPPPGGQSP